MLPWVGRDMCGTAAGLWVRAAVVVVVSVACAQGAAQTRVSVASDVTPWTLSGYSVVATVEPVAHWRFSAEVWGFEFPSLLVELNDANQDEGWRRRVDVAVAIYADYALNPDGGGFHFGVAVDAIRSTVRRSGVPGDGSFWSLEVLPRVGYRWFVWDDLGLFLNPWVGAGPLVAVESLPVVGGERFEESGVQAVGTVHLGWRL